MEIITLAMVLTILALLVWIPSRWIMGALDTAAEKNPRLVQWKLVDILALSFLLAVLFTGLHWRARAEGRTDGALLVMDSLGAIAVVVVWWNRAVRLSRAGIRRWWHRVAFLSLVVPIAVLGGIAAVPLVVLMLIPPQRMLWWFVGSGAVVAAVLASEFTRYIVRQAQRESTEVSGLPKTPVATADPWTRRDDIPAS